MASPEKDTPSEPWKVRLVGTGTADERVLCGVAFSTSISLDQADGLLSFYGASPELLQFKGPKAWYTDEPLSLSHFRTGLARTLLLSLDQSEWLHHTNINPFYRVPSPTHGGELTITRPATRSTKAVAVVTNFGGRAWWLFKGPRLRNRFILHPDVDLYGDPKGWSRFRRWPWSKAGVPANYKGPTDCQLWEDSQVAFLSGYKVAICLENTVDQPNYFTEKFVNAVRAGCIPVFYAHPTIRSSMLQGARWIDPADYGFDCQRTINTALAADSQAFQEANDAWLQTAKVADTHRDKVWERIADIMRLKLETQLPAKKLIPVRQ
ncbi:MAG: hypothetical protein JWO08_2438 [Verrucomicrobiaceae bacterium]|nr:hypothetical protein [Verrucomicrobiaceae bacterium]